MPAREQSVSVEWMRQRWLEHQAPGPEHFAAMASLLRTAVVMTEELDRVLKDRQLSRTGYQLVHQCAAFRPASRQSRLAVSPHHRIAPCLPRCQGVQVT